METIFQSIFKSWKTTLTALISGGVWLAGQYGIVITPEQSNAVLVVGLLIIGFFAKDSDVSGTHK
jgi:TRAP-type C4-dicarboxylate transport system permease large subunit